LKVPRLADIIADASRLTVLEWYKEVRITEAYGVRRAGNRWNAESLGLNYIRTLKCARRYFAVIYYLGES
jgi:hypothetical protein